MEKVSENVLLFCRNLQANGAQFFWDTLYMKGLYFAKGLHIIVQKCQNLWRQISILEIALMHALIIMDNTIKALFQN